MLAIILLAFITFYGTITCIRLVFWITTEVISNVMLCLIGHTCEMLYESKMRLWTLPKTDRKTFLQADIEIKTDKHVGRQRYRQTGLKSRKYTEGLNAGRTYRKTLQTYLYLYTGIQTGR